MKPIIEDFLSEALAALTNGRNRDPFSVLGPRPDEEGRGTVVRAFHPAARSIELRLVDTGELRPMTRRDPGGIFEAFIEHERAGRWQAPDYRLRLAFPGNHVLEVDDPYRYGRVLTDFDLHLFGEGTHKRAYDKLGAHRLRIGPTAGVHFAVWAPNADRVSVVGDFNGWDGRVHPMRLLVPAGIWEIFIPELPDGEKYKFEIRTPGGALLKKADPFGFTSELRPNTASALSRYARTICRSVAHPAGVSGTTSSS